MAEASMCVLRRKAQVELLLFGIWYFVVKQTMRARIKKYKEKLPVKLRYLVTTRSLYCCIILIF